MTAVGKITVGRTYFHGPACGQGAFGADRVLGVDGFVTPGAQRVVTVLGIQPSFAKAEFTLAETVGWTLDDDTIRPLGHATARRATDTRAERATAETFAAATAGAERPVDPEVQIDAGKVNTLDGWRDVKAGVFAVRERGRPTTPADWGERDVPAPTARTVIAAVEEASVFGDRCAAEARRLGQTDGTRIRVLGDRAEWIWNLADRHFGGATQVLDFWHGAEYLAAEAKAVFGDGTGAAQAALGRGKGKLLEDGYWGVTEWLGDLTGQMPAGGDGAALGGILNYFCGHQDRLHDAARLRRGQSIGSGLVEGSIKQFLNQRLKQTGARWKVEHVGPFVEFGASVNGPE